MQRPVKPVASPLTPQQQQQQQAAAAGEKRAGSPASFGQGARFGGRVVTTPEQLQRYMVCLAWRPAAAVINPSHVYCAQELSPLCMNISNTW